MAATANACQKEAVTERDQIIGVARRAISSIGSFDPKLQAYYEKMLAEVIDPKAAGEKMARDLAVFCRGLGL